MNYRKRKMLTFENLKAKVIVAQTVPYTMTIQIGQTNYTNIIQSEKTITELNELVDLFIYRTLASEQQMIPVEGYYYCVRNYSSHTAKNTLIKVLSRRMLYRFDAERWLKTFAEVDEPKCTKEFFVLFRKEPWSEHHRKLMKEWEYENIEYWQTKELTR